MNDATREWFLEQPEAWRRRFGEDDDYAFREWIIRTKTYLGVHETESFANGETK